MTKTLHGLFFEMSESLCQRYPSLTPFMIRTTPVDEVFQLVRRINARPTDSVFIDNQAQEPLRMKVNSKTATNGWY
jgi:hypothetical protein